MDELELKKFDMKRIKPTNVCAFIASRNSGKCLAEGTQVLMYDGSIKKIEDINYGDLVMGDDSTPRTICGTTNGIDDLYEIEHIGAVRYIDPITYTVNSHHVLSLFDVSEKKYIDIKIKDYLSLSSVKREKMLGYRVGVKINNKIRGINEFSHIKVSEKGKGKYYGFELDGNHRFVLGNFIVTHNSFLIRDLMYYQKSIPAGFVISKTDKLTHYYEQFIPPVLIHEEYSAEVMDKLFNRQKKALEDHWSNPHAFLIFDDVLADAETWKRDPRVKEIFYNGRHYKILFLLSMQNPMAITPGLRSNIDYTFILRTPNQRNRKNLYENYCGMFPSYEIFEKVLDACTEDYGCLVIDNTTNSNKLEDQVFYYKASDHENFRICANSFWNKKRPSPSSSEGTNFTLKNKNKSFKLIKK